MQVNKIFLGLILIVCNSHIVMSAIPSSRTTSPKIRVKIARNLKNVLIKGTDLVNQIHTQKKMKSYLGRKTLKFDCYSQLSNYVKKKPVLLASLKSNTGILKWNKKAYKGSFHVVTTHKKQSCDLINELSIDEYIGSLLSKEMNAVWPKEALKAQAIAARTYALHKMKTKEVKKQNGFETYYHIESSEKHQVSGSLLDSTPKTIQASQETSGEVLLLKGSKKIEPIFFHAQCGGRTLTPEKVWQNKVAGYQEVNCPYCTKKIKKEWTHTVNKKTFRSYLDKISNRYYKKKNKGDAKFMMVSDRMSKREIHFYRDNTLNKIDKSKFRKILGRKNIRSNNFTVSVKKEKVILRGKGYGHGVGLCQHGALEMAQKGFNYKEILSHFFPNHEIKKVY
jgi:stage II sporulation protein D